jgi:hypothetical protein
MGHNPSRWAIRRELLWKERKATAAAAEHAAAQAARDARLVDRWNAHAGQQRGPLRFFPTIAAAISAGRPWLNFECPGCLTFGDVDLRQLGRHPDAPISAVIPDVSCHWCRPGAPFARLTELKARSAADERRDAWTAAAFKTSPSR